MNNKGFSLVELLATIVILSIIVGITITGLSINAKKVKEKAEETFVGTIEEAINMYLDDDAKKLTTYTACTKSLTKTTSGVVSVSSTTVTLSTIMDATDSLVTADLVNPNNKETKCKTTASVIIYRDSDYVYYYRLTRSALDCLTLYLNDANESKKYITNLPVNPENTNKVYACR